MLQDTPNLNDLSIKEEPAFGNVVCCKSLHAINGISVADPDGVQGVRSNPLLAPVFKHPMNMNNLVSVRPNFFSWDI